MRKHTPGPWDVHTIIQHPKESLEPYHFMVGIYAGKHTHHAGDWERVANSKLIEAAPDMIEALRVAEAELEQHEPDDEYPGLQASYVEIMKCIRAAIAKAEGK